MEALKSNKKPDKQVFRKFEKDILQPEEEESQDNVGINQRTGRCKIITTPRTLINEGNKFQTNCQLFK